MITLQLCVSLILYPVLLTNYHYIFNTYLTRISIYNLKLTFIIQDNSPEFIKIK